MRDSPRGRTPRSAATALALLLVSCSPSPQVDRDPTALLQTGALSYALERTELGYRAIIPWTFRNETGGPVYLEHCDGDVRPLLEMDRDGMWFPAWEPYRDTCGSPPLVVPPGGTYADTLELFGAPPQSNVMPVFVFPEIEGVYRMVWPLAHAAYDTAAGVAGELLPLEQRVSNRFVLLR